MNPDYESMGYPPAVAKALRQQELKASGEDDAGSHIRLKKKPKLKLKWRNGKWSSHPVLHWRECWRAIADPEKLPPMTRLVMWEISAHMKNNGTGAYPGFKRIAKRTGLAISTVVKHADLAVALGWLHRRKTAKLHGKGWIYSTAFPKEQHK